MNKPRSYLNKTTDSLEAYLIRLGQDEAWCKDKADEFEQGAAAEHYLRSAQDARKEIERVKKEIAWRRGIH